MIGSCFDQLHCPVLILEEIQLLKQQMVVIKETSLAEKEREIEEIRREKG